MGGYINWSAGHIPLKISLAAKAHGHFKRRGCPWRSPAQMHLTLCTKPSFSPAAGLEFCSSSFGIFSIPVARQHWWLPKTSPRVGSEHAITMAVIWYWAMTRPPPSARWRSAKRFFKDFSYIFKDQHPKTAESSSAASRDPPRKPGTTTNPRSYTRQSHPTGIETQRAEDITHCGTIWLFESLPAPRT